MARKPPGPDREELDRHVVHWTRQLNTLSAVVVVLIVILFVIEMVRGALAIK